MKYIKHRNWIKINIQGVNYKVYIDDYGWSYSTAHIKKETNSKILKFLGIKYKTFIYNSQGSGYSKRLIRDVYYEESNIKRYIMDTLNTYNQIKNNITNEIITN